jgi:hypothetical protein
MDAETASIVNGGRPNNTNRFITTIRTIIYLGFSLNLLLLCYLTILVGKKQIDDNKKYRQIAGNFDCHAGEAV